MVGGDDCMRTIRGNKNPRDLPGFERAYMMMRLEKLHESTKQYVIARKECAWLDRRYYQ